MSDKRQASHINTVEKADNFLKNLIIFIIYIKMKILWFLLSCVFVNVSTVELMEYKKSVSISNIHIALASTKTIRRNNKTSNGLDYVIKRILENNIYSIEVINNMFAVPEYRCHRDWNVCKLMQEALRSQIQDHLRVCYREIPVRNFEELTLKDLGEQRRIVTLVALKRLWNQSIAGNEFSIYWTCRMIALFMSIKVPELFTRNVSDSGTLCTIYNGIQYTTYRKFEGRWWRVIGDDINTCIQLNPEPL